MGQKPREEEPRCAISLKWPSFSSVEITHMYCHALVLSDSFCETRSLSLPAVLSPLYDMDFVTIATESLSQYLQPLVTVSWIAFTDLSTLHIS